MAAKEKRIAAKVAWMKAGKKEVVQVAMIKADWHMVPLFTIFK